MAREIELNARLLNLNGRTDLNMAQMGYATACHIAHYTDNDVAAYEFYLNALKVEQNPCTEYAVNLLIVEARARRVFYEELAQCPPDPITTVSGREAILYMIFGLSS